MRIQRHFNDAIGRQLTIPTNVRNDTTHARAQQLAKTRTCFTNRALAQVQRNVRLAHVALELCETDVSSHVNEIGQLVITYQPRDVVIRIRFSYERVAKTMRVAQSRQRTQR